MKTISYARHRFPSVIIQHAVWLYLRVSLSYREIEDVLADRGLDISPMKPSVAGAPSSGRCLRGSYGASGRARRVAGTWTRWS